MHYDSSPRALGSPARAISSGCEAGARLIGVACLLGGYNVTLNSQYEAGTSIAGQSQSYTDLADFQATDPSGNPVTNPAGFTATISWGDGMTSPGDIEDYPGLQGLFEINGAHAYPNPSNGEYSIQVALTDPDGGVWYGAPSIATVNPPADSFNSNSGDGGSPSPTPTPTPQPLPTPANPGANPGTSGHANSGNPGRYFNLHAVKSGHGQNPSHKPKKTAPSIPTIPPTGPLQRVFPSPSGYTSYEFVGLRFNHQTPQSVMRELQRNPSRYFPFQITNNNAASSSGPIVGGRTYKLTPVPFVTDVLKAVNVTPTSFTLVVVGNHYVVPAGSRITFKTVVDSQGDVLLEQTAFVSDQLHVFPDQLFGPPAWAQQAANLRRDLGYNF